MAVITCTADRFDIDDSGGKYDGLDAGEARICGDPATQRVTITGADRAKGLRPTSTPTPWNLDRAPRCDRCAKIDRGIVTQLFPPSATFDTEPLA